MVGEPAATMADDKTEILAAIAALGTRLETRIDANHADLMGKIDVIATGTGRIEAELGTVKREVRELQARLDRKLDRHETRIEALEAQP